jgi:branched-chain amino acid transport system permease protein
MVPLCPLELYLDLDFVTVNFWDLAVGGMTLGAIYALVALGYTLVYGVLRLINFAHSEVFMVGTFAVYLAWSWLGLDVDTRVPSLLVVMAYLLVAVIAATVASGVTALVLERVAYRPLRKHNVPSLIFLITAIGASLAMMEAVGLMVDRQQRGLPVLVKPVGLFHLFGARVDNVQLSIILCAVTMMVALDQFISRTKWGRGVRAVAQDPQTAAMMGVNPDRIIALVFLLGGIMAGVAAVLYNVKVGSTRYDVGFELGIAAFAAAVLGGIGNLRGALLGGLVLGLVENFGAGLFGNPWRNVFSFVVLVLVLLVRPTGLLGERLGRARA